MLLYAPGHTKEHNEPIPGNTWLQKQMHELSKVVPKLNSNFIEHHFGVFSPSLDSILTQNKASNLIDQQPKGGRLILTLRGMVVAKKIWNESSLDEQKFVSETKKFFNEMRYWEIIAFSYSTHPETTINSEIKPDFEKRRLPAAIDLFKKRKISLKKAASVAGVSTEKFKEELSKRQIYPYELNEEKYTESLRLIENIT